MPKLLLVVYPDNNGLKLPSNEIFMINYIIRNTAFDFHSRYFLIVLNFRPFFIAYSESQFNSASIGGNENDVPLLNKKFYFCWSFFLLFFWNKKMETTEIEPATFGLPERTITQRLKQLRHRAVVKQIY